MTVFGVHTGLQNTTIAELRDLWTRIEDHGFDWISIWDHFYSADFTRLPVPRGRRVPRRPRLPHLARAGGVARLLRRLPAPGRARQRHRHDRPPLRRASRPRARRRLGVQRVRRLRHPLPVGRRAARPPRGVDPGHPGAAARRTSPTSPGTHVQLTEARCEPKPVQAELPIWVGGGGERRTLRIAAKYADGWNVPFVSPETIAHKRAVLADHCSTVGRDPVGDPHGGQRRSLPGRRRPRRAVRPARRAGAAGRDDRLARPARAAHRRVRRRPAPIRSTSPCGPRGT